MARLSVALLLSALWMVNVSSAAAAAFPTDTIKTSGGDLRITFIGHGSLVLEYNGKVIQVDPFGKLADYAKLPKADIILITHEHQDHLDLDAVKKVRKDETAIILTDLCAKTVKGGTVMKNGDVRVVDGIKFEAVPAYNLVHMRKPGLPFHPKGQGNGYVITFGDKRVYIAGDTENTPEMKALKNIDVALLPMNLPYTMTPGMVADAALAFKPKILYPYHTGDTDVAKLLPLMKNAKDIEVRIRPMK
jgi:L-ascorbate metabolism protein UlaG (beta-lactamase superfamily)